MSIKLTDNKPFTNGDMKRIGNALKQGRQPDLNKFAEVINWYDNLINEVSAIAFETIQDYANQSSTLPLHLRLAEVPLPATRIKSDDTIAEKLARLNTKLDRIQDFAGCRFDLDCTLSAQLQIAEHLKDEFEKRGAKVEIKNYLVNTQRGYRGIHLHITGTAGRCELQLRTLLQASWANLNEVLGDLYGRKHRYDDITQSDPGYELISDVALIGQRIKEDEERDDAMIKAVSQLLTQLPHIANNPAMKNLADTINKTTTEASLRLVALLDGTADKLRQSGVQL